jgi:hypothetical protein
MWRIIERLCQEEPSRGVLQGLLSGPLSLLARASWRGAWPGGGHGWRGRRREVTAAP